MNNYIYINPDTISIGYDYVDLIVTNNNKVIKYDNGTYHIILSNKSYLKFKSINNTYKVIYHDGSIKNTFETRNVKSNRNIEYRNKILIPNDIYKHILSYLGNTGSNEHVALACTTINPIDIIRESYIKTDGFFDPLMISDGLQKYDFERWNKIVNSAFISFLNDKPSIVYDILQKIRKDDLISEYT